MTTCLEEYMRISQYKIGVVLIKRYGNFDDEEIPSSDTYGHMFIVIFQNNKYIYRGYRPNLASIEPEILNRTRKEILYYLGNNFVEGCVANDEIHQEVNIKSARISLKAWDINLSNHFFEVIESEYTSKTKPLFYSFSPETQEKKHSIPVNNCVSWAIRKVYSLSISDTIPLVREGKISLITKYFNGETLTEKDLWKK